MATGAAAKMKSEQNRKCKSNKRKEMMNFKLRGNKKIEIFE